jgi:hypothetical protein
MENGKWKIHPSRSSAPMLLFSSATMLLRQSLRVLYSYRFFGVGWTVTGAGVFRFQVSNLTI